MVSISFFYPGPKPGVMLPHSNWLAPSSAASRLHLRYPDTRRKLVLRENKNGTRRLRLQCSAVVWNSLQSAAIRVLSLTAATFARHFKALTCFPARTSASEDFFVLCYTNALIIIIRPHRSTTYVDAAYCYRPSSVVCRSVTVVSPAKTAEPIEMPFGLKTRVGPRKHVLGGGAHWHNLANTNGPAMCGCDAAFLSNYFHHLLLLSCRP